MACKTSNADFVAVNASFADRRFVRSAHDAGKKVYVWTVNDAPTMSAMMSRGVDGLITDKPALVRSVLELRSKLSPRRTGTLGTGWDAGCYSGDSRTLIRQAVPLQSILSGSAFGGD